MRSKPRALINAILLNVVVLLLIVYIAGPFLWVMSASFQGENELLSKPPSFIPKHPTTDNYRYVFTGQVPTAYAVTGQAPAPGGDSGAGHLRIEGRPG